MAKRQRGSFMLTFILGMTIACSALFGNTFKVVTAGDSGPGSLRQAILDANNHAGVDSIIFRIDSAQPQTIQPQSALPTITDAVIINGYTQPGARPNTNPMSMGSNAILRIELDGTFAGAGVDGLTITAGNSTVRGIAINRFGTGGACGTGISLQNQGGNLIEGNYLGTDITGAMDRGNICRGLLLFSSNNVIRGNVISGNDERGIFILGGDASGNRVIGNYIGLDATGRAALGNNEGIHIQSAPNNVIGGASPSERNIISGNLSSGITVIGTPAGAASGNRIIGNYIGTDAACNIGAGNGGAGIQIEDGTANEIGSKAELLSANVISANKGAGISLRGSGAAGNRIWGNYIGTDSTASAILGNGSDGILLKDGARETIIYYTAIKYNFGAGIRISGNKTVQNEFWRGSITGNGGPAILLAEGGNSSMTAPIIIAASPKQVTGRALAHNLIQIFEDNGDEGAKWIGWTHCDAAGGFAWSGTANGPNITAVATDTTLDNSSMFSAPFRLNGTGQIQIVTNSNDSGPGSLREAIGIASGTSGADTIRFAIPSTDPGYDPITGVWVIRPNLPFNVPADLTIDGRIGLPGGGSRPGIEIDGTTLGLAGMTGFRMTNNTALLGLIVNRCAYGIWIDSADVAVRECYIGTDPAGAAARPNDIDGILLAQGAARAIIENNLISGNHSNGIRLFGDRTAGCIIRKNRIGTNADGTQALHNDYCGIVIHAGPHDNIIEQNLVSGNIWNGMEIAGATTHRNLLRNNFIGTDVTGIKTLANTVDGVLLSGGAYHNVLEQNLISGNAGMGLRLVQPATAANIIRSNQIGTDSTGTRGVPNLSYGVMLFKGPCRNSIGPENVIAFNGLGGILVDGADSLGSTVGNTITANSLFANGGRGIVNSRAGNSELAPPQIQTVTLAGITGLAPAGQTIEFYGEQDGQGKVYVGSAKSDPSGSFYLELDGRPVPPSVVATATDFAGSTSEFSPSVATGIGSPSVAAESPQSYALNQNYPNPFNPETAIEYQLPRSCSVELVVFDLRGRKVAELAIGQQSAGNRKAIWHGRDDAGNLLPTGVYLCRLKAGRFASTKKMILLR